MPSGLQDWDNASIAQIHCQCVSWCSGIRGPMGLVISTVSVLPPGLCQQPYNKTTRQLSLCEVFPSLKHSGREKNLYSKSVFNPFEVQILFICCVTGKIVLYSSFSKLIIEEEKKPEQSSSLLNAKFFKLCNLSHQPM